MDEMATKGMNRKIDVDDFRKLKNVSKIVTIFYAVIHPGARPLFLSALGSLFDPTPCLVSAP